MTLRQLYYFRNVAELRHYTKAAEISRASQSGLSHAIRELERELNVELFQKRGRNVELTKYGQLFLPYVQKALKMLESGVSRLADPAGPDTGTITIAGTPSLAQFASDIIVRYMADTKRAGVRLQFNQETTIAQLREHLLSGKVDLAFSTKIEHSQIGSTYIGEHPIVLLVSETHRFAQYGEVELRMLDGEDFIAFSPDCQLRKLVDEAFRTLDIHPAIKAETNQDLIMDSLVAANCGVALVPYPLGGIPYHTKVVPVANNLPPRQLYLMWNQKQDLSTAVNCFSEYIARSGAVFSRFLEKIYCR